MEDQVEGYSLKFKLFLWNIYNSGGLFGWIAKKILYVKMDAYITYWVLNRKTLPLCYVCNETMDYRGYSEHEIVECEKYICKSHNFMLLRERIEEPICN